MSGTVEYVHDPAGRLVSARYGEGRVLMHTYDPAGNLKRVGAPSAGTDTDQDGMEDTWETQFFGSLSRNGEGDLDQDGANDLAEFLAGTDPTDSMSALVLLRDVSAEGVNAVVRWHAVVGRVYRLQRRSSLSVGVWEDVPGDVTATGSIAEKTDSLPQAAHHFYRVLLVSSR